VVAATTLSSRRRGKALDADGLAATAVGFATADANPLDADAAGRRKPRSSIWRGSPRRPRCSAPTCSRGRSTRPTGVHRAAADRRRMGALRRGAARRGRTRGALGVTARDRAAEPLRVLLPQHRRAPAPRWCARSAIRTGRGALDTHHAHLEEATSACARSRAMPRARSATCSCRRTTAARPAPGRSTSRRAAALDGIDYRGWLVVEAFSRQDPEEGFGSALRIWRELDAARTRRRARGRARRPRSLGVARRTYDDRSNS
jgi:D-psicose/D-tagatose/L-ribulose 3-epimerase